MSAYFAATGRQSYCPLTDMARGTLRAIGRVWTAYLLKRAIADVATMSRDYRAVGLDRAEVLAALTHLREGMIVPDAPRGTQAFFSHRPSGDCCQ
jgi:hypothetical protein